MTAAVRAVLARVLAAVVTVVGAAALVQLLLHLAPGDPIDLLPNGEELRPVLEARWGLDRPLPARILAWLAAAATGDLGVSLSVRPGADVAPLVAERAARSAGLLVGGLVLAMLSGLALAVVTAGRRPVLRGLLQLLSVPPVFLMAYLLVVGLNEGAWALIQAGTIARPDWFALPDQPSALRTALAVGVLATASGSLGEVHAACEAELQRLWRAPFVTAARARGAPVLGLLVRNLLPELLSLAAARLPLLLGGLVILEKVLLLDGAGSLLWAACLQRDAPVAMAVALVAAVVVVSGGLLADTLRVVVDPRLRRSA